MVNYPRCKKSKFSMMMNRYFEHSAKDRIFHIVNNLVFILIALITFYPFFYVVKTSLEAYDVSGGVQIVTYNFSAYKTIMSDSSLLRSFVFTLFVVFVATAANLAVTMLCAYPLSRAHLVFKGPILTFVLIPMLFSGGLIAGYIQIRSLGLANNVLVYILPFLCSSYNVIIMKNFLQGLPTELEESAMLDGASDFGILANIYLPLSVPIIATVALWVAVGRWNDWITGLLYINNPRLNVIQVTLRKLLVTSHAEGTADPDIMNKEESMVMASIVLGTLPIILIYPFIEKYFVKGMILGSIKG